MSKIINLSLNQQSDIKLQRVKMQQMQQSALYRSIKVVNNDRNQDLPSEPKLLKSRSSAKCKINPFITQSSQDNLSNTKSVISCSPHKSSADKPPIYPKKHQSESEDKRQGKSRLSGIKKSLKTIKNKIIFQAFSEEPTESEKDSIYKYMASNLSRSEKQSQHKRQSSMEQRQSQDTQQLLYKELNSANDHHEQSQQVKLSTFQSHQSSSRLNSQNINNSRSNSKLIKKQTINQSSQVQRESKAIKQSTDPQFILQNRFYHYCAEQIVSMALESKSSEENIKKMEVETAKIREKNMRLEQKIEEQKLALEQFITNKKQLQAKVQRLSSQLHSVQSKVQRQLPQTYKTAYTLQYNEHKHEIDSKMGQIKLQENFINQLKYQISLVRAQQEQQLEIERQNELLREQIEKVRLKRMEVDNKLYRKGHLVSHLQQVKELEFDHLVENFVN